MNDFLTQIREGIPDHLPELKPYDPSVNHAPRRRDILTTAEKKLALRNALRYFPVKLHGVLAPEFAAELREYGRIYMYRYRPSYAMKARPVNEYPHKSLQAAAIMLMITNNLDPAVAQHPHELITYGGNGAVFQNWAQYRLTMKYLSEMTDEQTLVMESSVLAAGITAEQPSLTISEIQASASSALYNERHEPVTVHYQTARVTIFHSFRDKQA